MHAPELKEQARQLRTEGALIREIADQIGVPKTTVARWLNPTLEERERVKARKRKFGKKRTCPQCGRLRANTAALCQRCYREGQRYWTRERIIDAVLLWAANHGRRPTSKDWERGAPDHPAVSSILNGPSPPFKTWAEAVQAAGFRLDRRRKPGLLFDRQKRATLRRDMRETRLKRALEKGEQGG